MDLTLALSAVIFTLLAIVVATSLLNGSSPVADFAHARGYFSHRGSDESGPTQNGHAPEGKDPKKKKKAAADDWCEISGSSHDHWDVVKSVLSEEAHPQLHNGGQEAAAEHSCSTVSSLSVPSSGSRNMSLESEGAAESPEVNENALKYVPGKSRSHHLQTMMSKEELVEEQRVQREQLAAIFQLLSDNRETFGETSEGDMEEQLRLYSI